MTDPFASRPTPVDPWGREVGEDRNHLLDAAGHVPHQSEPVARLLGEPKPVGPPLAKRSVDPKLAIGILLLIAVVIAVVLVAVL